MSEDDFKVFKRWLSEMLDFNIITVTFFDDEIEQVMKCTTAKKIAPTDQVMDDMKLVYDTEANAWRSFRWDSVTRIEFNISGNNET